MPKRARQVANPAVREHDYIECLKAFKGKRCLHDVLGATVSQFHRLTPSSLVRCVGLLELLVQRGIHNGVVFTKRLECAVKAVCTPPALKSPDLYASEITDHVRICFSMIRQIKLDAHGDTRKSAAFRRHCSATDLIVIESMVNKISLHDQSSSNELLESMPDDDNQSGEAADAAEDRLNMTAAEPEDDMRSVFKRGQQTLDELEQTLHDLDNHLSETASTAPYDEVFDKDGFPIMRCGASSKASSRQPSPEAAACAAFEPVDPCSRRRRAQIMKMEAVTPKKKAKVSAKPLSAQKSTPDASGPLHRGRLAITKDGRCEVTAFTMSCNKRVHVVTVLKLKYGPLAEKHMSMLVERINTANIDKAACLKFKSQMQASATK